MPAIGAKQRRRQRERSRCRASHADIKSVDLDQVMRHPQRQRDKRPEHEEIVKREAPDLEICQWRELFGHAGRARPAFAARDKCRVVLGEHKECDGHDRKRRSPDIRDTLPAVGNHDEGGHEFRDGRADVTGPEDPECGSLATRAIPARDIGHADDERPAREADPECRYQVHRIGRGKGQQPGGRCRQQHLRGEYQPPAVFLGPDTQKQSRDRPCQNWCGDQKTELELAQAKFGLDGHTDDREYRPNRETGGKSDGAERQGAVLIRAANAFNAVHVRPLWKFKP